MTQSGFRDRLRCRLSGRQVRAAFSVSWVKKTEEGGGEGGGGLG